MVTGIASFIVHVGGVVVALGGILLCFMLMFVGLQLVFKIKPVRGETVTGWSLGVLIGGLLVLGIGCFIDLLFIILRSFIG